MNNELSPSDLAAFPDRLVEVMDAAAVVTDDAFVVTAWNAAAEALYGWRADEVVGRRVGAVLRSDLSEAADAAVREQTTAEGSSRLEVVTHGKDGARIDVELINIAVRGPDGNVAGYLGVHREISGSHRIQREGLRLQAIIEASSEFIATAGLDRRGVFLNEAGRRLVGIDGPDAVAQTELLDYFAPDDVPLVRDEILPLLVREGRWTGDRFGDREIRLRHVRTGELIAVLWDCYRLDDPRTGEPFGFGCVARAVRDGRRVQHALDGALERVTDAYYALDGDWNLTHVNARAVALLAQVRGEALTRDELIGRNLWELFPALVGSEAYKTVHRALHDQRTADFEFQYPDRGRWLDHHAYPTAGGLSVSFRDVTARVQSDAERRRWARQQAHIADFGRRALVTDDLQALMNDAVRLVALALDVEVVRIGEVLPGGAELAIRAGLGLAHGVASSAREPLEGAAGFALALGVDVVSDDLDLEERFAPVRLAAGLAPRSAAAVVIRRPRRPFGVLEAQSGRSLAFSATDLNFMQSVANVLGTAADRADAGRRVRAVRESDRRRIARDLQEEALRDVTELLAETERGRASGVVPGPGIPPADVPGVLRRVGEQLRSAIHDLQLGGDEDRPFLELVQDLVAVHQAAATDASVDLHVRDGIVPDSLGARGTEVLRILGEALTNARRHSGARRITVELRGLADGVHATVADDGRGFADRGPATDGDRHGLRAMGERAELAGARLEISSEVGLGTEVRVHLPVAPWSEGPSASVRVLLPMEEIVALLRHAGRQREQEADDRAAIEQLTPRELELLQALAEGLDGGAIAERLHISRRTERNHFTNILNKLGVHSRLQALVLALRYDVVRITRWPPVP